MNNSLKTTLRFNGKLNRRWWLLVMLFFIAVINYFDRQSLSVLAPQVQRALHISDTGYGDVISGFLLASAISYLVAGFLTDWIGTRWSMALFVGWWSASEALTSLAHSLLGLGLIRFSLGLGEPGLWVAAPKAVSEWFSRKENALAVGIYTSGATVGAVLALPVIIFLNTHLNFGAVFLLDGAAGLIWIPLWLSTYTKQGLSQAANASGAYEALDVASKEPVSLPHTRKHKFALDAARPKNLGAIFLQLKTWRLLVARALTDSVWYFYLFWFPKYLFHTQRVPVARIAHIAWIVYLAAGIGTLGGGWWARALIQRGMDAPMAHRNIMLCCALAMPLSPLVIYAGHLEWVLAIAAIIALSQMSWLTNLTALVLDLFPSALVGTASGLIAAGSAFGGMIFSELSGHIIQHAGYAPLFWIMGFLHLTALIFLWPLGRAEGLPLTPQP